jgi:hypothetical protein
LWEYSEDSLHHTVEKAIMSKRMLSTILLFAIGVGFAIASFTMFLHAQSRDDVIQALLDAVPAVAAFGAIIMLPFRQTP